MTRATPHAWSTATALSVFLIGWILATPAAGQLTLESSSPSHGATEVDDALTLSLTFSAPLDTAAAFEQNDELAAFLAFELVPEPGADVDLTLSDDRRTVSLKLNLEDDTQYWGLVQGAKSASGNILERPYAFTFTTGNSLPEASVSGTLRFDEGDPIGTLVGLFPESFFTSLLEDDTEDNGGTLEDPKGEDRDDGFAALAVVSDASGAYTMDYVPAGRYVMVALKDVDQDGDPTLDIPGEGIGAYESDTDRIPDVVDVHQEALTGFDLVVRAPIPTTAHASFADAQSLAASQLQGAATLTATLAAGITPGGTAGIWAYVFYNADTPDTVGVVAFYHLLSLTATPTFDDENPLLPKPLLNSPVADDWIDSDSAMAVAETIGGADYRARNPEASVFVTLFNTDFAEAGIPQPRLGSNTRAPAWNPPRPATAAARQVTAWTMTYFTFESFDLLQVVVDAQTGAVLRIVGQATTAEENKEDATEAALAWKDDAVLIGISTVQPLDAEGLSTLWNYTYYAPATQTARTVLVSSGTVVAEEESDPRTLPSLNPLPEDWIDSAVAAGEAEANSDGFRSRHADTQVFARLTRGLRDHAPDRLIWRFTYVSEQDFAFLDVDVDARSGGVIVGAEEEAEVPNAIVLHQNYPNPFNPETNITYDVHQPGRVELAVYDGLGRRVRTLVNSLQTPGSYTVTWSGRDNAGRPMSSGLYFYELRLADAVQSRAMTLLR